MNEPRSVETAEGPTTVQAIDEQGKRVVRWTKPDGTIVDLSPENAVRLADTLAEATRLAVERPTTRIVSVRIDADMHASLQVTDLEEI